MTHFRRAAFVRSLSFVTFSLVVHPLDAQVVINELMYHPASDNENEEFLELHNPGASAVDLQGWCFTGIDFCFPAASIPAGGFIVLASNSAQFQSTYGFTPDFEYTANLSNAGEIITLQNAAKVTVDQVSYDDLPPWPVTPDGLGPSLELIDPTEDNNTPRNWRASLSGNTAGVRNSVAGVGLPPGITNVRHGTVQPVTPITVNADVVGAASVMVFYTLGFGAPEASLTMFDDGVHGDGAPSDGTYGAAIPGQIIDTLVRYLIVAAGPGGETREPSVDDTIKYLGTVVLDPALTSQLPIFHWWVDPVDYLDAINHKLTDQTEPCVIFYNGVLWDGVQFRVRGQSARNYPKNHWQFEFPKGHDFSAPGFTVVPVDQFNLQGNWADKSHVREILAYETFTAAGVQSLITSHVRVEQNGAFYGLYTYLEQPDDDWVDRHGLDPLAARYKADDDLSKLPVDQLPLKYEKKSRLNEDYSDLYALVSGIADLTGQARRDFLFDNLNLPVQLSYMAATIVMHNDDHVKKNYYLYRDTAGTGRWTMYPWDMDLTFGRNYNQGVLNDNIWSNVDSISGRPDVSPSHPLFGDRLHQKYDFLWNKGIDALLAEPEVREMFFRRLRTVMDELLVAPVYENRINQLEPRLQPEADLDRAKWGQYGQAQTLTQSIDLIRNDYLPGRRTHLFTTHRVAGEIPAAQSATPAIVINEIMYNPTGGPSFEFVELYNPSATESVDLSFWTLSGINLTDFTIGPGTVLLPQKFAMLVRDDSSFRAQYGSGKYVSSQYSTNLDNAGTSLVLRNRQGVEIDRVDYGDSSPWPSTSDGGGPSLELVNPALDNADPANWAASLDPGGTPGAPNSVNVPGGPPPELYINEVLPVNTSTNSDEAGDFDPWVEIYNADPLSVDMSGMFLSNVPGMPGKWPFPAGTTICSGCFLLVWADNEPGEGPLHANFRLSATGGTLTLSTPGLVTIDTLTYGALAANVSYGRFPDGSAALDQLVQPTPNGKNKGDQSPLHLNEYSAVSTSNFLKNNGSDTFWGRVMGNGGDWFELVVAVDHLDIRGWKLIVDDLQTIPETLTFTNHALLSDLRSGTILTVSEVLADDPSYDPAGGDWWINVQAGTGAPGTYLVGQNFPVSNDNWQLTIQDASGQTMFGPAGEGVNPIGGVGSDEVCKLEEDPGPHITPFSNFRDGSSSTFGSPNLFSAGTLEQDFSALRSVIGPIFSVAITSPTNGSVLQEGGNLTVRASALSSPNPLTQVEFFANNGVTNVSLGLDLAPAYVVVWSNVPAGNYALTAVATNSVASTKTSSPVNIRVNRSPSVSLTSPAPGGVGAPGVSVPLAASATDTDGTVSEVEFFVGATSLGIDTSAPYGVTWTNPASGTYSLTAVARDNDGGSRTSAPVSFRINTLPAVTLTSPALGTIVNAGDTVNVTATATDSDGGVARVQFFANDGVSNVLIGTVTAAPYTWAWTSVKSGVYTLTAVATDVDGGESTSSTSLLVRAFAGNIGSGTGLATPGAKDGGLAWGDFNNDGCQDVIVNTLAAGFLYIQGQSLGACLGTFTDVTACLSSGLSSGTGFERSVIWGDVDNDGDVDFARNKSNAIEIYLNNGAGSTACGTTVAWSRFGTNGAPTRVLSSFTFPSPPPFNTEFLAWIDFDEDGDLDLLSDNDANGIVIWKNDGTGSFTDVAPATIGLPGTGSATGGDYGAVADFNVDGFVDVLVRKDGGAADLFRNQGDFFAPGVNIESASNANKGGVAFCDFDNDLDFDIFWTDAGVNQIWRQDGGNFTATGLPGASFFVSQQVDDAACADFDNDGDLDLFLSNDAGDFLFENTFVTVNSVGGVTGGTLGGGTLGFRCVVGPNAACATNTTDVPAGTCAASPSPMGCGNSEGSAFADYDRDGDVDLLINNNGGNQLWQNRTNASAAGPRYLMVSALHVDQTSQKKRAALGATVSLEDCSGRSISGVRDVNGGRGHGAQDPPIVHFGLTFLETNPYLIQVKFPGGVTVQKAVIPANLGSYQILEVTDQDSSDIALCATPAVITSVTGYVETGRLVVEWETAAEVATLGFRVYRQQEGALRPVKLTGRLLSGLLHSPEGGVYRFTDETATPPYDRYRYFIAETDFSGVEQLHGPFVVDGKGVRKITPANGTSSRGPRYTRARRKLPDRLSRALENRALPDSLSPPQARRPPIVAKAIKLYVSESGIYRVAASEIAPKMGLSVADVQSRISKGTFALTLRGEARPWYPDTGNTGIYFYGEAIESIYTRDNVYWLTPGNGLRMATVSRRATPVSAGTFVDALHVEKDAFAATVISLDPESDYWFWESLFAGDPAGGERSVTFSLPGIAPSGSASLAVHLQGATTVGVPGEHRVEVRLNGTAIGQGQWSGVAGHTARFSFDQSLLRSSNTVTLGARSTAGVDYSIFYLDSFDVTYRRTTRAEQDALAFTAVAGAPTTISGFTGANIVSLDVSDPRNSKWVRGSRNFESTGVYRLSLGPAPSDVKYVAAARSGVKSAREIRADVPSNVRAVARAADYVVVTRGDLAGAASRLAAHRELQGLRTAVIDLEDIYDELNSGIASPHAVRTLVAGALEGGGGPRYLVLAGEGTFDYKDNLGFGTSVVPPLMVRARGGLFASDRAFVQGASGGGVPRTAVGRIPARTAAELGAYVDKIMKYEGGASLAVVLLADDDAPEGSFGADTEELGSLVPPSSATTKILLGELGLAGARQKLFDSLKSGAALLNYFGHGGVDRLASEGLLTTADVPSLGGGGRPPIVTAMTCNIGRFDLPQFESLGEALVLSPDGGALALWSASGLSYHPSAKDLGRDFFTAALGGSTARVGDAILEAWRAYLAGGGLPEMQDAYNLLGDPASVLR